MLKSNAALSCKGFTSSSKGFTLVEVMVALAIFAVAALSLTQLSASSSQRRYQFIEKELAMWLAKDQLVQVRLNKNKADKFLGQRRQTLAGIKWLINTEQTATSDKNFYQLKVSVVREADGAVAAGEASEVAIVSLQQYFRRKQQ